MEITTFVDHAARRVAEVVSTGGSWNCRTDFDGTISDFVAMPDAAVPRPEALDAYLRMAEIPGVDAGVLSARPLSYLAPMVPPALHLECSLGLETRHGTRVWRHPDIPRWQPRIEAFTAALEAAIQRCGGRASGNPRDARDSDAVLLEVKPTSVTAHCSPALSRHPSSHVRAVLAEALAALEATGALHGLVPAGDTEFVAPLSIDSRPVDKGTIVGALPGPVLYAGDAWNDVPAARTTRTRGGLVLVVNRSSRLGRAGSPLELLALADVVVPDTRTHAAVIGAIASKVAAAVAGSAASLVRPEATRRSGPETPPSAASGR